MAAQVPFVFASDTSEAANYSLEDLEEIWTESADLAGVPLISSLADNEPAGYYTTAGSSSGGKMKTKTVRELKDIFNRRVEPDNTVVHDKARILASVYPGEQSIGQISAIYFYLKKGDKGTDGWHYVPDPRGVDYYSFANESLSTGEKANCAGAGDCDDFAILMSALIESVGGTTRIVLAFNNSTGHAYAEVYLGKLQQGNGPVNVMVSWLKENFDTKKIYTHIDSETKEVWLNLDWGEDQSGLAYPGGPFFKGNKHILVSIRDEYDKVPLTPPKGYRPAEAYAEGRSLPKQEEYGGGQEPLYKKEEPSEAALPHPSYGGESVDSLTDGGIASYNQGDYREAVDQFQAALSRDENNYLAWELKGLAWSSMAKYDEAISCFDQAIAIDPSRDHAWRDKGETLYIMGRYQESVECLNRAIGIRPCASYWKEKGEALMGMGWHKEASDAFVRAQTGANCAD